MNTSIGKPSRAWFQLLRPPNLLTVPGDTLAGFALAGGALSTVAWWPAVAAGLLLYAAGLVLNDVADFEQDLRERPRRPLPSGRIPRGQARRAGWVLLLSAFLPFLLFVVPGHPPYCHTFESVAEGEGWSCGAPVVGVALGLASCVVLYTFRAKRHGVMGPVLMGLCRGLNLLLGAGMVTGGLGEPRVALAAASLFLFVAAVTRSARREAASTAPARPALALPALGWMPLPLMMWMPGGAGPAWLVALAGLLVNILAVAAVVAGKLPRPNAIGIHISMLLWLQAAWLFSAGAGGAALGLLLLWPVFLVLSRWFYAS